MVLIFCVEFRELSHFTRDLSQAEKKINVVIQAEPLKKMTTNFTQNDIFDHFVHLLSLYYNIYFLLSLR